MKRKMTYIADDGKEFENELDCLAYEGYTASFDLKFNVNVLVTLYEFLENIKVNNVKKVTELKYLDYVAILEEKIHNAFKETEDIISCGIGYELQEVELSGCYIDCNGNISEREEERIIEKIKEGIEN